MIQVIDYIISLLEKQSSEFDHKIHVYIKLLKNLKSLEKDYKSILVIQKRIFVADLAEKYLRVDTKKSENILIYCKESLKSQSIKSMELKFWKNKTMIKLKNKLLNILNKIDFNQRLLQKTVKTEIELDRLKFNEVHDVLTSSLDVHKILHLQNTIHNSKNYYKVITVNSLLNNQNEMEQTFNANLRNIIYRINSVKNERDINITISKQLNKELDELKKKKSFIMISIQKNNDLKANVFEIGSNLKNKIHNSNTQLTITIENNEKFYNIIQLSDSLFKTTYEMDMNVWKNMYQILSGEDQKSNKVTFLYNELKIIDDTHNKLLLKQKEIMMNLFNEKKYSMEIIVKEKSEHVVRTHSIITSYENKINIYELFTMQLKNLKTSIENSVDDLLLIYNDLVFQNHGKNLKQLEDEEAEFISNINIYNTTLDELNDEDRNFENYSKHNVIMKMKARLKIMCEKLQQITSANTSLDMEINRKTI